ncbi:hypothetical protein E2320_013267, partial [Naja naja]
MKKLMAQKPHLQIAEGMVMFPDVPLHTPDDQQTRRYINGMTKRTYVEAVLEGIKQCQEEGLDIDVRFLVSVDRSKGAVVAKETVKLAGDFLLSTDGVVLGLDLSGNPKAGHGQDFLEPLLEAKKAGLKLTLHLSETDDKGVFATELSTEYQLVAETFQLSNEEIWALSSEAIDH